jgi:hypothetical protein
LIVNAAAIPVRPSVEVHVLKLQGIESTHSKQGTNAQLEAGSLAA